MLSCLFFSSVPFLNHAAKKLWLPSRTTLLLIKTNTSPVAYWNIPRITPTHSRKKKEQEINNKKKVQQPQQTNKTNWAIASKKITTPQQQTKPYTHAAGRQANRANLPFLYCTQQHTHTQLHLLVYSYYYKLKEAKQNIIKDNTFW